MLAVPCCRRCGSMDSGGKGAEGACHRVRGALPRVAGCGVGGGGRSMSAMDLSAFGCGRLRPRGGDCRHGYSGPPRCGEKHRGATPDVRPPAVGVALWGEGSGGRGSPAAQVVP